MKRTILTLTAVCITIVILHSFRYMQASGIKGTIVPASAASVIWAIKEKDTLKTALNNGTFTLPASPGNWKLIVDAKEPYKDAVMEKVVVTEGQVTDVGEIKLEQ